MFVTVVDVPWPSVAFSIKGDTSKIKVSPLWSDKGDASKRKTSAMMSPSHEMRFTSARLLFYLLKETRVTYDASPL
jgi:hypothetical protein